MTQGSPEGVWGERYLETAPDDAVEEAHTHGVPFLACLETGLIEVRTSAGAWVVFPRTVTFVPADFPHSVRAMSAESTGWKLYLPKLRAQALGADPYVVEMSDFFLALCLRIVECATVWPPTPQRERLTQVALDEVADARPHRTFQVPLPKHPGLVRAAAAILRGPSDMSRVEHWAKFAGMSRRSFSRHFAAETGLPFGAWRHRVKIHAALRMLAGNTSVTRIGLELGYASTSAFIAMFRRLVGVSPTRCARRLELGIGGDDLRRVLPASPARGTHRT